ncbi:helix-turn-helix domain-containing protein [Ruminococcaceae bacterium OttesenSCG-928-L11]|nr:helix-turn-helix domain-containing protein [Ruminococcaceae bacterium OttesenSCG-928-L11]
MEHMELPIKKNTSRILTKYITSYFAIVLVFVVLVMVLYNTNYTTSKNVTDAYVISSIENGIKSLEDTVVQINAVSSYVKSDPNLVLLANQKTPLPYTARAQIIKFGRTFLSLNTVNSSVERLYLVLPNGVIFSSDGVVHESVDQFYGDFLAYEGLSADQWLEKQFTDFQFWESIPVAARNILHKDYLTYNCRGNRNAPRLIALIAEARLLDLFLPREDQQRLGLQIMDTDHTLLDTAARLESSGKDTVIERHSDSLGLTVRVVVPSGFYADSIQSLTGALLIFTVLVILIGIAMSVVFGLWNSKPTRSLATFLTNRGESMEAHPADSAQRLLTQMDENLISSEKRSAEMKKTLAEIEFQLLISSDTFDGSDNLALQDTDQEHVVVLIRPQSPAPDGTNPHLAYDILSGLYAQEKSLFRMTGTNRVVLLHPWSDGARDSLNALARELEARIAPLGLRWAVSRPFSRVADLKFAYLEAQFASFRPDLPWNSVIFFSDIDISISNPLLSLSRYNKLDLYLSGDSPEKIHAFFDELCGEILASSLIAEEIRQITYLIRSILINHNSNREDYTRIFHLPHLPCNPPELACMAEIRSICLAMVEHNIVIKRSHNDKLREDVIALIASEYNNPDLSLSWLADRLHTTPKYISNFISEQLGRNYTDYIQEIRMVHAGHLLKTTDLSINQVAAQVGYMSANAFYKGFRRYYGLPPSEYKLSGKVHSAT